MQLSQLQSINRPAKALHETTVEPIIVLVLRW
jgi:hypothetical protein